MTVTRHPAPFSKELYPIFDRIVRHELTGHTGQYRILDPFAGEGGVHNLAKLDPRVCTVGVELEPEWAHAHPNTVVGDATHLPTSWLGLYHMVLTSPTYGNRMADHHEAKDTCKACRGEGIVGKQAGDCKVCRGTGLSHRRTYKHYLGRDLAPRNTGAMQWGDAYRTLHRLAWEEAWRVLTSAGLLVLNCKNHIRGGVEERVTEWHAQTCLDIGFLLGEVTSVATPGFKFGQNGEARKPAELVMTFRKP